MTKSNPRILLPSLAIVFGLAAAACGAGTDVTASTSNEPAAAEATTGDAPAESIYGGDFIDLNGQSIDFASFEGQDTVLWFWAPW